MADLDYVPGQLICVLKPSPLGRVGPANPIGLPPPATSALAELQRLGLQRFEFLGGMAESPEVRPSVQTLPADVQTAFNLFDNRRMIPPGPERVAPESSDQARNELLLHFDSQAKLETALGLLSTKSDVMFAEPVPQRRLPKVAGRGTPPATPGQPGKSSTWVRDFVKVPSFTGNDLAKVNAAVIHFVDGGCNAVFDNRVTNAANHADHDHGTRVVSMALSKNFGVLRSSLGYLYSAFEADGSIDYQKWISALKNLKKLSKGVVNLSGGGRTPSLSEARAIAALVDKGIVVVAASGNFSSQDKTDDPQYYDAIDYPAAYASVISVGGCKEDKAWWPGSRHKLNPNLSGGVGNEYVKLLKAQAKSANPITIAAPAYDVYTHPPQGKSNHWTDGTSFAAPAVAAIIAARLALGKPCRPNDYADTSKKSAKLGAGVLLYKP